MLSLPLPRLPLQSQPQKKLGRISGCSRRHWFQESRPCARAARCFLSAIVTSSLSQFRALLLTALVYQS